MSVQQQIADTGSAAVAPRPAEVAPAVFLALFSKVFALYLFIMALMWAVGIEGIYGSPMPFYALVFPVFGAAGVYHLIPLGLAIAALLAIRFVWPRINKSGEPSPRACAWSLVAIIAFAFLFSCAVAMLRGGADGIAHAYNRQAYEYIGDIGRASGIKGLFTDYIKIRPYLSMHAKVHPPGPIAILWLMSLRLGQDPMALSLATIAFGVSAILPLYLWVRDMTGRRTALACCMLYSVMPTVVLFTATSADILFMPFTLWMMFYFWRAATQNPLAYGLPAGIMYGLCSLLSFSLVGLGAFFALIGIWRMTQKGGVTRMVITALTMLAGLALVHVIVWKWSGFDVVACFRDCKAQFDLDQAHLDELTPRYPAWVWRVANPAVWFYFAGIPVSVLLVWRLARPDKNTRGLFIAFGLTLVALNFLYLARGEGERSAMYIMPFMLIPAAHMLGELSGSFQRVGPFSAALGFMAFQCWFTESFFYTFW